MSKLISIIIPAYNNAKLTINCLADVSKTSSVNYEVLLIDDGSTDPIYKLLGRFHPTVKVIRNETNLGFIRSVNRGIQESTGDYILLLNNDVCISDPLWLSKMLDKMAKRQLDMCALAGGRLDEKTYEYIPGEAKKENDKFSYLPFWCCLIKREVIDEIGVLDEAFSVGFWDDVDFCYRAKKAGYKLGIVSGIQVKHLYHQTFISSGYNINKQYKENRQVFLNKIGVKC